jgi:uncharacterized membrane protein (GlpM family)
MNFGLLITKALLSGALVVFIGELAKRNNFTAAIVHSLPLVSLLALIWLFHDTRDTGLVGRHMTGTFWFVLPTLPMFLVVPWLLRSGWQFWPALGVGALLTVGLYFLAARLLKAAGVNF